MSKQIGNEVTAIINTILERCKKEKDSGYLLVPLDDHYERVSYYTAFPKFIFQSITNVSQRNQKQYNIYDIILVLECIKSLLGSKNKPIVKLVHKMFKIKKAEKNPSEANNMFNTVSSFCSQLRKMGFLCKRALNCNEGLVVVENPKITFNRYHYFRKMTNADGQNRSIYYIDERCFDSQLVYSKPTPKNSKENEYCFFLMISPESFYQHGLFTNEITEEAFYKWVLNIVLPMINNPSVIVMTNSYLHGSQKNQMTRFHTKFQMQKWLDDNEIPYVQSMNKAELYELIDKCIPKNRPNHAKSLFESYGHEVINLPQNLEEISPVEFLWQNIKENSDELVSDNIFITRKKLYDHITNLDESIWRKFFDKSHELENKIFTLDVEIESNVDSIYQLDPKFLNDNECEVSCDCYVHHLLVNETDSTEQVTASSSSSTSKK